MRRSRMLSFCVALGSLLGGLLFLSCQSDVITYPPGCDDCPERCLKEGTKVRCVACLVDTHCQTSSSPSRKCINNLCYCGTDTDCPQGQYCAGTKGDCVQCLVDAHCKSPDRPVCGEDRTCSRCEGGKTRACVPAGREAEICQKGNQTCLAGGVWDACKDYKECAMCSKPLLCVLGDRRCTGDPAAKPGKFVSCELDDKGCGRWSSSIQACGSEETCKGGECLPTTCQSPVCGVGTTRCSGEQAFQTCGRDAKGCIVWLPQESCSGRCDAATGRCSSCTPQTEVCDGQDNDCDGKIDEDFPDRGQACEVGQGECKKTGKKVCSPDKTAVICDATALSPTAEICDGKDNDCNGQIDDKAPCPNGQPCLNGFCGKPEPGCADGTRELFTDMAKWPTIAGCAGFYRGESLRAGRSSSSCGSSEQNACAAAEDLCASGWHVCTKSGDPKDLSSRVTDKDCATAGTGLFVAASSHCQSHQPACNYGAGGLLPCTQGGPCSEPLCCGKGCDYGLCKDGLWPAETRCARPQSFIGCANANSFHGTPRIDGVLCCKD